MPLPIIPIVIAGLSLFGIGTGYLFWKKIKEFWKGKNIVILGGIQCGKTTLHNFLRKGTITKTHQATRSNTKVKKNTFKLKDLELKISVGVDVSGLNDFLKDWKSAFMDSGVCFYMIDVQRVFENDQDYINLVENHFHHMNNWVDERKGGTEIILLGVKCDLINEYNDANESNIQEFEKGIRLKIKKGYNKLGLSASKIFFGSLQNKKVADELLFRVLSEMENS